MLQQFEDKLRSLRKRGRRLEYIEKSCWTKFCGAMRPLKVNTLILYYRKTLILPISHKMLILLETDSTKKIRMGLLTPQHATIVFELFFLKKQNSIA